MTTTPPYSARFVLYMIQASGTALLIVATAGNKLGIPNLAAGVLAAASMLVNLGCAYYTWAKIVPAPLRPGERGFAIAVSTALALAASGSCLLLFRP